MHSASREEGPGAGVCVRSRGGGGGGLSCSIKGIVKWCTHEGRGGCEEESAMHAQRTGIAKVEVIGILFVFL